MSGAAYDEIAIWYDENLREGSIGVFHDFLLPIVLDFVGDVEGQHLCDLACGQGIVARRLAGRGAKVTAVDVSENLLDLARLYEQKERRGISYVRADARDLTAFANESFDGVVCNMALMDMPDLEATLGAVARIVRPGGWFVFSITHPCFNTPGFPRWVREDGEAVGLDVRDYFTEGHWRRDSGEGIRGKLGAYHRTLGAYVNGVTGSGMVLEHVAEPRPTGRLAETASHHRDIPAALVARCRKPVVGA